MKLFESINWPHERRLLTKRKWPVIDMKYMICNVFRDERQLAVVPLVNLGTTPATSYWSYRREAFMSGEVFYLCVHSIVLAMLLVILMAYAFHTGTYTVYSKA